jgi:hypothetical protein
VTVGLLTGHKSVRANLFIFGLRKRDEKEDNVHVVCQCSAVAYKYTKPWIYVLEVPRQLCHFWFSQSLKFRFWSKAVFLNRELPDTSQSALCYTNRLTSGCKNWRVVSDCFTYIFTAIQLKVRVEHYNLCNTVGKSIIFIYQT